MDKQNISTIFYSLVAPSHPNEWEVEELVDTLAPLSDESCRGLLEYIPAIWPISHSLCYGYLRYGSKQVGSITLQLLPEWVRQLLFHYEKGGLRQAERFMIDVERNFVQRYQSTSEVNLSEISMRMTHYIRGVSGRFLRTAEDTEVWTDTATVYLPLAIDIFPTREDNKLFYKFLITYQAVLIDLGVFTLFLDQEKLGKPADSDESSQLKHMVARSEKASCLLKIFLFIKGCCYIKKSLPGLWNRSVSLFHIRLIAEKEAFEGGGGDIRQILGYAFSSIENPDAQPDLLLCSATINAGECRAFIDKWKTVEIGELTPFQKLLIGEVNFERAERVVREQREADKKAFIKMLAMIIPPAMLSPTVKLEQGHNSSPGKEEADGAVAVILQSLKTLMEAKDKKTFQLENTNMVVPEEFLALAEKIAGDFGSIPIGYVQAASGVAGEGRVENMSRDIAAGIESPLTKIGYIYDEWDCRRNGYRSDWCTITEEELPVIKSDFLAQALQKHSGLRKKLRAQFELMKTSHRFVRRQRDGDDLDLDAITDAMGDKRAGKSVSDRLFVRLMRDERNIATLFLIDMSNSTSGWIGTFIKEAVILLCEAMEMVGDQYGIYGFSGMRRSGCKLYHIKRLDDLYDADTRDRIAAVGPKDYTRMAPAIRHLTTLLEKTDAKTRLLISLSDGKPEDYDGYNGEYAIEDTRKALLEAKGKGIHPFCITVDKQAHDYLDHMFGSGNYIFINRIENLPAKMAQIYRVLTR